MEGAYSEELDCCRALIRRLQIVQVTQGLGAPLLRKSDACELQVSICVSYVEGDNPPENANCQNDRVHPRLSVRSHTPQKGEPKTQVQAAVNRYTTRLARYQ